MTYKRPLSLSRSLSVNFISFDFIPAPIGSENDKIITMAVKRKMNLENKPVMMIALKVWLKKKSAQ